MLVGTSKAEVNVGSSDLTLRATALGANDTSENVSQDFTWKSSQHEGRPRCARTSTAPARCAA